LQLSEEDARGDEEEPANDHDDLCADDGDQLRQGDNSDDGTDAVDDISKGGVQGSVAEDVLESQRRIIDHGVHSGRDTHNGHTRSD